MRCSDCRISLNHMLDRLRDSVQTSRRFLADASHELRTPLTVIKGELQEVMARETARPRSCASASAACWRRWRASSIWFPGCWCCRDWMPAKRSANGWMLDLGELAAGTVEQMRLVAEDRGVRLQAATLRTGNGARRRARAEAGDSQSARQRHQIHAARRRGDGLTHAPAATVRCCSRYAIPASAFRRRRCRMCSIASIASMEARSREDGGAGLGLSIVRSICSAHGAAIEVESTPGNGSCFRVKFPQPAGVPL